MRYAWVGLVLAVGCAATTPVTCVASDMPGDTTFACRDQAVSASDLAALCANDSHASAHPVCTDGEVYCLVYQAVPMPGSMSATHAFRCDDAGHLSVE